MASEWVRIYKSDKKRLRDLFPSEDLRDPVRLNKLLDKVTIPDVAMPKIKKGFYIK